MPWKLSYNEELEVVETVFTEPFTPEDISLQGTEVFELANEKGTNLFLVDLSTVQINIPESFVYYLPDRYNDEGAPENTKIALLEPKTGDNQKIMEFYTKVCADHGYQAKFFPTREEAINWLKN